jgi:hypothetical protein
MSVRKEVVFTDDLSGTQQDVKTVTFGFEGKTFEIDLGTLNRRNLERSLAKYIDAARPVKAVKGKTVKAGSGAKRDLSPVREWAKAQGMEVSDRGRISKSVLDAYSNSLSASV